MISISKITSDSVIDYAAEELKKYLRMMMPESGEVKVSYAPSATAGFKYSSSYCRAVAKRQEKK